MRKLSVTEDARTARLLDVSATIGSFFGPLTLIAVLLLILVILPVFKSLGLDQIFEDETISATALQFLDPVNLLIAPLILIITDWMSRRPWRLVSSLFGLWVSILITSVILLALSVIAWIAVQLFAGELEIFATTPVPPSDTSDLSEPSITYFGYESIWRPLGAATLWSLAILMAIGLPVYAYLRQRAVQFRLALDVPRARVKGDLDGAGFGKRLGFLSGFPALLWHRGAFKQPSFWMFLFARPFFQVGYILTVITALVHGAVIGRFWDWAAAEEFGAENNLFLWMWMVALLLLLASHGLFALGKRAAAFHVGRSAKAMPALQEAPILFLRSFQDDHFRFRPRQTNPLSRWLDLWSFRRNLDQILVDEFEHYGPAVALGRPGEKLPGFGSRRYTAKDNEWQAVIEETARKSQFIVVAAGTTDALIWEYEMLKRLNLLYKTIILFPPHEGEGSGSALQIAKDTFDLSYSSAADDDEELIAIVFGNDSTPTYFTAKYSIAQDYLVALRRFVQEQIYPVTETNPHPIPVLMRVLRRPGIWATGAGLLLLAGFVMAVIDPTGRGSGPIQFANTDFLPSDSLPPPPAYNPMLPGGVSTTIFASDTLSSTVPITTFSPIENGFVLKNWSDFREFFGFRVGSSCYVGTISDYQLQGHSEQVLIQEEYRTFEVVPEVVDRRFGIDAVVTPSQLLERVVPARYTTIDRQRASYPRTRFIEGVCLETVQGGDLRRLRESLGELGFSTPSRSGQLTLPDFNALTAHAESLEQIPLPISRSQFEALGLIEESYANENLGIYDQLERIAVPRASSSGSCYVWGASAPGENGVSFVSDDIFCLARRPAEYATLVRVRMVRPAVVDVVETERPWILNGQISYQSTPSFTTSPALFETVTERYVKTPELHRWERRSGPGSETGIAVNHGARSTFGWVRVFTVESPPPKELIDEIENVMLARGELDRRSGRFDQNLETVLLNFAAAQGRRENLVTGNLIGAYLNAPH